MSHARRFCGLDDSEAMGDGKWLPQWPHNDISYRIDNAPRGLTVQNLYDVMERVSTHVESFANVRFVPTNGTPNIHIDIEPMDGAGGTLAYMYVPFAGITPQDTLNCRLDSGESFADIPVPDGGRMPIFTVLFHEVAGHGLGLSHERTPAPSIMDPFISQVNQADAWTIAHLQARYGKAVDRPIPSPEPGGGFTEDDMVEFARKGAEIAIQEAVERLR